MIPRQIDCFNINMKFWTFLGVWAGDYNDNYYKYYSRIFVGFIVVLFNFLYTVNLYFLPRQLEVFVEEMILYLTEIFVMCKVFTFFFMRKKIIKVLDTLESEVFRPDDEDSSNSIDEAKVFTVRCWKIVAATSVTSNLAHILTPLIFHIFLSIPLQLPVCSYAFLPEGIKESFLIYVLYIYQCFGIHCHMLYNVNIDGFLLGLMNLIIAQLRILDKKLRYITSYGGNADPEQRPDEARLLLAMNKCVIHYTKINDFCKLVEDLFSIILFAQFGVSSCIICVCLFRFTLPAPVGYYVFLATFITIMIGHILVPCWFGTRIIETSTLLSTAIYSCDWTPRSRQFKSSLRLFVERASKPLSLTGGKMFPLSLETFTSIMNSAYSFFTLLRNVQSR